MDARAPRTIVVPISGRLERWDLDPLCARVHARLERGAATRLVCDVQALEPDAVAVDALARLALSSRRTGIQLRLRRVSPRLRELLELAALTEVLLDEGTS